MPAVQISTMTPIALMVGSNRVIPGAGIVHPVGNIDLDTESEKQLRKDIVKKALEALAENVEEQTLFSRAT